MDGKFARNFIRQWAADAEGGGRVTNLSLSSKTFVAIMSFSGKSVICTSAASLFPIPNSKHVAISLSSLSSESLLDSDDKSPQSEIRLSESHCRRPGRIPLYQYCTRTVPAG